MSFCDFFPRAFKNLPKKFFKADYHPTPAWPLSFSALLGLSSVSGWVCENERIQVKPDEPPRTVQESFLFKEVLFAHFLSKYMVPPNLMLSAHFPYVKQRFEFFIVGFLRRPQPFSPTDGKPECVPHNCDALFALRQKLFHTPLIHSFGAIQFVLIFLWNSGKVFIKFNLCTLFRIKVVLCVWVCVLKPVTCFLILQFWIILKTQYSEANAPAGSDFFSSKRVPEVRFWPASILDVSPFSAPPHPHPETDRIPNNLIFGTLVFFFVSWMKFLWVNNSWVSSNFPYFYLKL